MYSELHRSMFPARFWSSLFSAAWLIFGILPYATSPFCDNRKLLQRFDGMSEAIRGRWPLWCSWQCSLHGHGHVSHCEHSCPWPCCILHHGSTTNTESYLSISNSNPWTAIRTSGGARVLWAENDLSWFSSISNCSMVIFLVGSVNHKCASALE